MPTIDQPGHIVQWLSFVIFLGSFLVYSLIALSFQYGLFDDHTTRIAFIVLLSETEFWFPNSYYEVFETMQAGYWNTWWPLPLMLWTSAYIVGRTIIAPMLLTCLISALCNLLLFRLCHQLTERVSTSLLALVIFIFVPTYSRHASQLMIEPFILLLVLSYSWLLFVYDGKHRSLILGFLLGAAVLIRVDALPWGLSAFAMYFLRKEFRLRNLVKILLPPIAAFLWLAAVSISAVGHPLFWTEKTQLAQENGLGFTIFMYFFTSTAIVSVFSIWTYYQWFSRPKKRKQFEFAIFSSVGIVSLLVFFAIVNLLQGTAISPRYIVSIIVPISITGSWGITKLLEDLLQDILLRKNGGANIKSKWLLAIFLLCLVATGLVHFRRGVGSPLGGYHTKYPEYAAWSFLTANLDSYSGNFMVPMHVGAHYDNYDFYSELNDRLPRYSPEMHDPSSSLEQKLDHLQTYNISLIMYDTERVLDAIPQMEDQGYLIQVFKKSTPTRSISIYEVV